MSDAHRVEVSDVLRRVGHGVVSGIGRLGYIARFFTAILIHSPQAFRRLHPAFGFGFLFIIASQAFRFWFSGTPQWLSFAQWLVG